jgi:hypothetical protein
MGTLHTQHPDISLRFLARANCSKLLIIEILHSKRDHPKIQRTGRHGKGVVPGGLPFLRFFEFREPIIFSGYSQQRLPFMDVANLLGIRAAFLRIFAIVFCGGHGELPFSKGTTPQFKGDQLVRKGASTRPCQANKMGTYIGGSRSAQNGMWKPATVWALGWRDRMIWP